VGTTRSEGIMKPRTILFLVVIFAFVSCQYTSVSASPTNSAPEDTTQGTTPVTALGAYRNLFVELLGQDQGVVDAKVETAVNNFFTDADAILYHLLHQDALAGAASLVTNFVIQNMAVDCYWFGGTASEMTVINWQLAFFLSKGINSYGNGYTLDGTQVSPYHSQSVVAMNAVGALLYDGSSQMAKDFVNGLWNAPQPTGTWRYYDGCLYMFGLLHCSGNYIMIGFHG
jgi:hypothetical protein